MRLRFVHGIPTKAGFVPGIRVIAVFSARFFLVTAFFSMALFGVARLSAGQGSLGATRPDDLGLFSVENEYFKLLKGSPPRPPVTLQFAYSTTAFVATLPVAGDFNANGTDSVGVYDLWTNEFLISHSTKGGDPDLVIPFGSGDAYPVAGDFDGDGLDTIGVYVPSIGEFQLRNSNSPGLPDLTFPFGPLGGLPICGDFNGDGIDTVGVYLLTTGHFHLRNSNSAGPADLIIQFGTPGSYPFIGDFDGDSMDTIGVIEHSANRAILRNVNAPGSPDDIIELDPVDWRWWPVTGNWKKRPLSLRDSFSVPWSESPPSDQRIDEGILDAAYQRADDIDNLYSLLVVRHGVLVAEDYFEGYTRNMSTNVKSVSKSVLSALVGIALRDGDLQSVDQKVSAILPQYFGGTGDPQKEDIDIRDVLTMTSGLAWNEGDIAGWFYSPDWNQYVLDQPLTDDPGTRFLYSTGLTHLMSQIITEVTGQSTRDFAEVLFAPLGVDPKKWDHDHLGLYVGGAELYLTPREMARFGQLYLDHGVSRGQQILPADWVTFSTSELVSPSLVGGGRGYGCWWWLEDFSGYDAYFAWGFGGQFIFNFPSLDLVVVMTSKWAVSYSDSAAQYLVLFDLLENYVLPAIMP